jgi:hypothetical protein
MKALKYILIAIAVLIFLFFAMGLLNDSVSYGSEIVVDKPVEEAWAVGMDDSKYPLWLEGFKSIELIEGEKGVAGSKYRIIVNPGDGQPDFEMIETLQSITENESVHMTFDSEVMDFVQIMEFSEADGKTTITTKSEVMGKGIFMRSMFSFMETFGGAFSKQEAKNQEALKKLINENTTVYQVVVK